MVGDYEVPFLALKRGNQRIGIIHTLMNNIIAAALEFAEEERCVVFGILDDQ
jgi:hypothetical protein